MQDPRVIILTGAGASTELGRDGHNIAMMGEWATSLIAELGHAAELLGLRPSMRGDEFEEALGRYIAFAKALPHIEPLHPFGARRDVVNDPVQVAPTVNSEQWMSQAHENVNRVQRVLHDNLYRNFNQNQIDDESAYDSYSRLHKQIRSAFDKRPVYVAHVTTNFDHAIEAAIDRESGDEPREIRAGFARSYGGRSDTWAPELLTYGDHDGIVPVLHLHGAVGWYFTEDGNSLMRRPSEDPYDERHLPALLLPDNKKDISTFPGPLSDVWVQFERLLANSTHVLVLGHSLHDPHLVKALSTSDNPVAVVAYTEPGENGSFDLTTSTEVEALRMMLPSATFIAGKFGQRTSGPDVDPVELKLWLRDHRPR